MRMRRVTIADSNRSLRTRHSSTSAATVWAWAPVREFLRLARRGRGAQPAVAARMQACGTGECDALPCGRRICSGFQQERWHGIRPVLWGSELRETSGARHVRRPST
ncbi:MAG: hypothetical protein ACLU4B_02415 [Bilophila wadsworthia]